MIYIFWTCASQEEAETIIRALLDQKLIACGSILPNVRSLYRWEGRIEEGLEVKVILKSISDHFEKIKSYIEKHSSYDVSEILQVDISQGNPSYIEWVKEETSI